MFAIFASALNAMLGWVFRSLIIKFAVFFGLFFVTSEFMIYLQNKNVLPNPQALQTGISNMPSSVLWFLDLFVFGYGLPLICAAWATRFIIRRIPLIG